MVTIVSELSESAERAGGAMARDELESELERLHRESFGWALACCERNRSEAEDVLQMTYVKVLDGSARFDGRSRFRTWLFGVIRRTASERRRSFAVRDRLLRWLFSRQTSRPEDAASDRIERSAESARLIDALSGISRRQREVLELVFYHEMTIEEAATTMGIGLGSARTHYERGKKNLQRRLEEDVS